MFVVGLYYSVHSWVTIIFVRNKPILNNRDLFILETELDKSRISSEMLIKDVSEPNFYLNHVDHNDVNPSNMLERSRHWFQVGISHSNRVEQKLELLISWRKLTVCKGIKIVNELVTPSRHKSMGSHAVLTLKPRLLKQAELAFIV